ncbi:MAG TPA: hypothetical protein VI356_07970 [Myxococcales bacterium]
MIRWLLAAALSLSPLAALAQNSSEGRADAPQRGSSPTPMDANHAPPTSQRGSRGSTAGGAERTGTPGAGIESGDANGMAGGRTDEGPRGGTGIRGTLRGDHTRARARANAQARGPNQKGSFDRPAETAPQIELNPKVMGSGAPMVRVEDEPQPQGRNYFEGPQPGAAGGIASGTEGSPGGAAVEGTAGKGAAMQPDKKAGGKAEGGHDPK